MSLLTGVLNAASNSRASRYFRRRGDAIVGTQLRDLDAAGRVHVLPHRVVGATGREVRLSDGTRLEVSTVLWCTGFRSDTSWIDVKVTAPVEVATPYPTSAPAATGSRLVDASVRSTSPRQANGPNTNACAAS